MIKKIIQKFIQPSFNHLFGMTTNEERNYLWNYGRHQFQGAGHVIDLGCWLGSTTIPLIDGLIRNSRFKKEQKLFVYDTFIWEEWMNPFIIKTEYQRSYEPDQSFLPEFKKNTVDYLPYIQIMAGDLCVLKWNKTPIEFLVVDAMKSWDCASSILHDFYPYLIPGRGIVFHQDFCHYFTYWIHIIQYRLRHYFQKVEDIPGSPGTVFFNTDQIPSELLQMPLGPAHILYNEINQIFDYSLSLVRTENRDGVIAAKIMCLLEKNLIGDAEREFQYWFNQGVYQYDMQIVEKQIQEKVSNHSR